MSNPYDTPVERNLAARIAALEAENAELRRERDDARAECRLLAQEKVTAVLANVAASDHIADLSKKVAQGVANNDRRAQRIQSLRAELAELKERVIQTHTYRLPVIALDVGTGEQGVHWIDGLSLAEVLSVLHDDVPAPVYESVPNAVSDAWIQAEAELAELKEQYDDLDAHFDHQMTAETELAELKARRCETCDEWDGPIGNGMGKCCVWTISSSPADPGCGRTHFRDTRASGYCNRYERREP